MSAQAPLLSIGINTVDIALNLCKLSVPQLQSGDNRMKLMVLRGSDARETPELSGCCGFLYRHIYASMTHFNHIYAIGTIMSHLPSGEE